MADRPSLTLSGVVLGAPDARALAEFYRRLLGWEIDQDGETWVTLRSPSGGPALSFQYEPEFERPVWPSARGEQQMTAHLDIEVQDLAAAGAFATELGATLAEYQPQQDVRVYLDPAGHPFCLWVRSR